MITALMIGFLVQTATVPDPPQYPDRRKETLWVEQIGQCNVNLYDETKYASSLADWGKALAEENKKLKERNAELEKQVGRK